MADRSVSVRMMLSDLERRGEKKRVMGLPGRERSLTISSVVWIQSTNVDRQTFVISDEEELRLCDADSLLVCVNVR